MKFYLAPLEGITGFIYRNAYEKTFHNIDKYFIPFIVPNQHKKFKTKELKDIMPEHNEGMYVVPQILTKSAEQFIDTAMQLKNLGYDEINLNLGCPSGTVVSKGKGSGFLAFRDELDKFLEEIFTQVKDMKISIKTRLGKDEPEEFYELIKIFNKYPLEELIIHARTQKDFYKNKPNLKVYRDAMALSTNKLCYNGDIFNAADYERFIKEFPDVDTIMLARGVISNPALLSEIKGEINLTKELLINFLDDILENYMIDMRNDERIVLFKMKEIWSYMIWQFSDHKKHFIKIRKSQTLKEYKEAVASLFAEQKLVKGARLFEERI